jgi:exodeoxyribonuclease V alpha subunit
MPFNRNSRMKLAERLKALATGRPFWPEIDSDKAVPWVEQKLGVTLAQSQREAVRKAVSSKVMVITGGPGVGKTTLVNAILRILVVKGVKVALAAPTGRAAKRLSESTGMEAKTIHRLLEVDPKQGGFKRGIDNPLECDLLVVDETSMVDVPLMASLVTALPDGAALMVVGDVDQLPSVGPGQVLADIIDSGAVPVARLTEIFRQAAESQIITNAHRVNSGYMPNLDITRNDRSDFYFVEAHDPEDGVSKIVEIVKNRLPKRFGFDPIKDIQVLCPMNRGGLGARALNVELQKALNPTHDDISVERFGFTYRVGDKVMQTDNDYDKEVFNGDLGYIRHIDIDAQELVIEFDGKPVEYQFGELDEVALAYAISIPIMMQHYMMLRRNLLYTGITRGKELVVLVGQKKAVGMAVKGKVEVRRWSKLGERMAKVSC